MVQQIKPDHNYKVVVFVCTGTYQKFPAKFIIHQKAKYIPELSQHHIHDIYYMSVVRQSFFT